MRSKYLAIQILRFVENSLRYRLRTVFTMTTAVFPPPSSPPPAPACRGEGSKISIVREYRPSSVSSIKALSKMAIVFGSCRLQHPHRVRSARKAAGKRIHVIFACRPSFLSPLIFSDKSGRTVYHLPKRKTDRAVPPPLCENESSMDTPKDSADAACTAGTKSRKRYRSAPSTPPRRRNRRR